MSTPWVQILNDALKARCRRCNGTNLTLKNEPPIAGFPIISYVCRDCDLDSTKKDEQIP